MTALVHDTLAEIAAEAVLGVLQTQLAAGTFDAVLADVSANVGDMIGPITRSDLVLDRLYVPVSVLHEQPEQLTIGVYAGPELAENADIRLSDNIRTSEQPQTMLSVECQVPHANSVAIRHLERLTRQLSAWVQFADPTNTTRRGPRRITGQNLTWESTRPWFYYNPNQLRESSVFFSMIEFNWMGFA